MYATMSTISGWEDLNQGKNKLNNKKKKSKRYCLKWNINIVM